MNDAKVNILQITVRADIGGGPEHLLGLLNGFSSGINCIVAAPKDEPYFNLFKGKVGDEYIIEIPHRKFTLSSLLLLRKEVRRRNVSIIHSHGKGAGIYSRLLGLLTGIKVIHTLHGFHIGNYNPIQKILYVWLEKLFSAFTYRIITVSEGEKREIINAKICDSKKITVIPNGVKLPEERINKSNFDQFPKRIISFSRFNYQKNTALIVELCKSLKELKKLEQIEFHIYGEGDNFDKIKREIDQTGLQKSVFLHSADPNARAKLVDGFCYISTSRWEGLPLSILEAMAVGLPVLATDVTGNNDVIFDGKNGMLYSADDLQNGVDKILEIINSKELWEKLSVNARRTIEDKFDIKKMIHKTEQIYLS